MRIEIDANSANQRFDRFLRKYCKPYPEVKLSDIFSRIRRGAVKVERVVDGEPQLRKRKEDFWLEMGDVIEFRDDAKLGDKNPLLMLTQKEQKMQRISESELKKMILSESEHWLVFDKPAGIVLHEGNKHRNDLSMNDYLEAAAGSGDETFTPSFGYRLDKDTSGVLIAAKTYDALQKLNSIIRERNIDKNYLCLVVGKPPQSGTIDRNLEKGYDKAFGKSRVTVKKDGEWTALTDYEVVKSIDHKDLGPISLLKVKIHTGRMHQIRVHLAHIGYPVLGDLMYGNPAVNRKLYKVLKISRQLLHCYRYGFDDPYASGKLLFTAPIPDDFVKVIGNIQL